MKPKHYSGDVEPLDLIEAQDLGFHEGNIVKYVSRWKRKNGLEDLKKAQYYLNRLIEKHEKDIREARESANDERSSNRSTTGATGNDLIYFK